MKRGQIYYVRSNYREEGSEQRGGRPAVIVSNDKNNANSNTVEVVYMTTKPKTDLPTHVYIESALRPSTLLCEQISTVSEERIGEWIGELTESEVQDLDIALAVSLGMKCGPGQLDTDTSFSGGLDSTVLAYIVCQAYRKYKLTGKIPLVFADTGTEFPEIREFVKTYTEWLKEQFPELDIELVVIRPKHSFKWVCENKGFPITSKDTAGKIRKLRHGKLSEKYRNYLLNGDKRGKFGMLAKKWQYLTDTERMPADISEYCCDYL